MNSKEYKFKLFKNITCNFYPGWHHITCVYMKDFGWFDDESYDTLHISLGWGSLYINFPVPIDRKRDYFQDGPEYGFYFYPYNCVKGFDSLWIRLGNKSKVIEFPWSMNWYRTSHLLKDGTWYDETYQMVKKLKKKGIYWSDDIKKYYDNPDAWSEDHDYTYVLNSGEIQKRIANIKIVEREWRPRWFMWTKLFSKKRRVIEVQFNDEVGEESGTWKGGCMGCNYEIREGEAPFETLRRMEKERKF